MEKSQHPCMRKFTPYHLPQTEISTVLSRRQRSPDVYTSSCYFWSIRLPRLESQSLSSDILHVMVANSFGFPSGYA
jgi:hypothetical protein